MSNADMRIPWYLDVLRIFSFSYGIDLHPFLNYSNLQPTSQIKKMVLEGGGHKMGPKKIIHGPGHVKKNYTCPGHEKFLHEARIRTQKLQLCG